MQLRGRGSRNTSAIHGQDQLGPDRAHLSPTHRVVDPPHEHGEEGLGGAEELPLGVLDLEPLGLGGGPPLQHHPGGALHHRRHPGPVLLVRDPGWVSPQWLSPFLQRPEARLSH